MGPISKRILQTIVILLCCLCAISCGGGTVGTGTGGDSGLRSIEGDINYTSGQPVQNAAVTILETGESTTTDANGEFSLPTESSEQELSLEISTDQVRSQVTITTAGTSQEVVNVDLTLDPVKQVTSVSNVSVTAKIEGNCDPYFENSRTIRQSNRLASGTHCPVNVRIRGDGRPLGRIPFVVQHSDCEKKHWKTDVEGVTNQSGFGTKTFTYYDQTAYCYYRIIAPYNVKGLQPVTFLVKTFKAQSQE